MSDTRRGRTRSEAVRRAVLEATRDELAAHGYDRGQYSGGQRPALTARGRGDVRMRTVSARHPRGAARGQRLGAGVSGSILRTCSSEYVLSSAL
ncbi:hypothetical protein, partial [Streptomyces prunicolor]|uniref:hypothetical protein n=1 Tax=Streptomyces prunicolor TaxID=67348 RepID=UPI0033EE79D3